LRGGSPAEGGGWRRRSGLAFCPRRTPARPPRCPWRIPSPDKPLLPSMALPPCVLRAFNPTASKLPDLADLGIPDLSVSPCIRVGSLSRALLSRDLLTI